MNEYLICKECGIQITAEEYLNCEHMCNKCYTQKIIAIRNAGKRPFDLAEKT